MPESIYIYIYIFSKLVLLKEAKPQPLHRVIDAYAFFIIVFNKGLTKTILIKQMKPPRNT
jgi:hypothetical protein